MTQISVKASAAFRQMTVRAILSIIFFVAVYLLLFALAIGLTIVCCIAGVMIMTAKISFIMIMAGAGLICLGVMVLIFLLKFLFSENVTDRSHLIEIKREDEPALFAFIGDIAKEVNTSFPKKIFISPDVNASVFYDSGFWSMFMPVRKNLQIGLALVNTISKAEFKAIMAHEFGHFSQRSMKVGSYVYNVNRVIFNLLYENESYENLARKWSDIHGAFAIAVSAAIRVAKGIQWVLKKVYDVVNLSYMALSREMEFHADEVAAHIAGSKPLITSLMRMELADSSYNAVISFYNNRITQSTKTTNIYPQQQFVLQFLAKQGGLPTEHNLPVVHHEHLSRYNKSKLNIKNQWASHPGTEERVARLEQLDARRNEESTEGANTLFTNLQTLQNKITAHLFASVSYETQITDLDTDHFAHEFVKEYEQNSFARMFNSYYDHKNPAVLNTDEPELDETAYSTLFDDNSVDLVYTSLAMENDLQVLKQIGDNTLKIKTFDYDGKRYSRKDCPALTARLETELSDMKAKISANDARIYGYFYTLANRHGYADELKRRYQDYIKVDQESDARWDVYVKIGSETGFMQQTHTFEDINIYMATLKNKEEAFKTSIREMLGNELYQREMTPEIRSHFEKYTSETLTYFNGTAYDDDALSVFFTALNQYHFLMERTYFRIKKDLLEYFEQLQKMK